MDISKQIVDQRVRKTLEENSHLEIFTQTQDNEKNISKAFLLMGVASFLDRDVADIVSCITEGGDDGGFDAAYMEPIDNTLYVTLFQAKYVRDLDKDSNFPANAVEKSVNTVKSVFDPRASMKLNENSRRVVDQIRSYIADGYIPAVTFVLINNGLCWNKDGQNKIDNEFKNQHQVKFLHFNHEKIVAAITRSKTIDAKIHFSGKAVGEQLMYKPVVVGRVNVAEIAGLMAEHGDNLLERNVRKYLGINNAVNRDIHDTLLNHSGNFFFYNNGITMVCKNLRYNELQKEDWVVHAEHLQIINGGQTCRTIHETVTQNPGADYSNTFVLVRVYAVGDDEQVVVGVTKATNTQSPIDMRDLHANEPEQQLLEVNAKELGYVYKRKRDAVMNLSADTITSSVAAEAVFVVWRDKPHLVGRKRNELFNPQNFNEIFSSLNASQMIIAVLILRYCDNMRRRTSGDNDIDAQRSFSQYALSSMISKRLLSDCELSLKNLNHNTFHVVKKRFDQNREMYYDESERHLIKVLTAECGMPLSEVDGRSLSAFFRRFEFIEKVLSH